MSLFRRFRRDKDDESAPAEEPAGEPVPSEPSPPAEERSPAPVEPTPPATAPTAPEPPAIPPPLPDRPAEPSVPSVPASDRLPKCFVCGTPLKGRTCPTCRMTWVE